VPISSSRPPSEQTPHRESAGVTHWIKRYKNANVGQRPAGLVSGPTDTELKTWRNQLHKPNGFLPDIDPCKPTGWKTQYQGSHSQDFRKFEHKSRLPASQGTFDKITKTQQYNYSDDIIRPFMAVSIPDQEKKTNFLHAGKDTQETAGWDGTMSFDSVYSLKYVNRDTASQIVFG